MSEICINGMILTGENWSRQRKSCPSTFFFSTNATVTGLESSLALLSERPPTNRLNHEAALDMVRQGAPGGMCQTSGEYVKLYRYNPKHLYPKLNGYGDNGHRKVWASGVPSVTSYSSNAHARQRELVMQWPWQTFHSTVALTSQDSSQLRPVYSTLKPKESEDMNARVFVVQFNGFMSLTSYFDVKYRY